MTAPVSTPVTADDAMPSLSLALDPQQAKKRILRRLLGLPSGTGKIAAIRVIRYKPGRRCVIEYEISDGVRLIGKVRAGRAGDSAFRLAQSLWKAGFDDRSEDGISIPEPVGVVRKFRLWLQRKVPGETATTFLENPGGPSLARRIAEAAFKLHRAGVLPSRKHSMSDEVRILHDRLPGLADRGAAPAERIDRLLEACDRVGDSVRDRPACGIHRDFYSDQVLVDSNRLYLIDFDLYCLGDPALDIGNFVAHVTEQSLRTFGDAAALSAVESSLRERYLESAGESHRRAIDVYAALTLARLVHLSTIIPERRPWTQQLLNLAESRLRVC